MNETRDALNFTPAEPRAGHRLQVAPLVDIVFLLVCFFMLTSRLIQTHKDPEVELPIMTSPDAASEVPAEVTVNLRPDGALSVGGRRVAIDDLAGVLTGHLDRGRRQGEAVRVVVRADRRQRFARLDEVLEVCRRIRLPQVVFRARGDE
ncbi:MAG: hypothetical protein AMS14_03965 [Planctomycetes bacterium DG_20]|nr:MAG: hypothetical protein AMS14_03965 [Planctomycetes bacterium DG_20]